MKLSIVFIGALVSLGCATDVTPEGATELLIFVSQTSLSGRPALTVKMKNISVQDVCIRNDLLEDPYTYSMSLNLRMPYGHRVKVRKPGFLTPPLVGVRRLAPGDIAQGTYYADSRFKLGRGGLKKGMSAKVKFYFDRCDNSLSLLAHSQWQMI